MQYYERSRSPFAITHWTRRIIIANAVVYLLQITVFTGSWLFEHFAFTPFRVLQQPWTAVSYMFLHGGALHLFFNMLMLFFFGPAVEDRLGSASFARYYLLCGLGGAAFSFIFAGYTPVVGASAAVFGVSLAFAVYWPDAPIFIFPLPIPIKAKWLVAFLAVSSLVSGVLGASDGIAHFAHLGGFLFGAAYLLHRRGFFGRLLERSRSGTRAGTPRPRVYVHPAVRREEAPKRTRRKRWSDETVYEEVDRVLDKISESGIDSLTAAEKRFLDDMSKHMRER